MRYGFCTGFASTPLWAIQGSMLARIRDAGFDYAELPAMSFADMDPCEFSSVLGAFETPVACNLFPGRIPLVSWERDLCVICDYLDVVLSRAVSLGIGKIVFGSGASRSYDPSCMSFDEAMERLRELVSSVVVPKASEYGVTILLEPLKRGECNLINTVEEGYSFVRDISSPWFLLMADIYHMNSNGEPLSSLEASLDVVHHIHIAGSERSLEDTLCNPYILCALSLLKSRGYDETISFETCDGDIAAALKTLKAII